MTGTLTTQNGSLSGQNTAPGASFADTFDALVRARGLSNLKLASLTGHDQSYFSRLRTGSRVPSRDALMVIAAALELDGHDTDRLLAAAGFMPGDVAALLESEPLVARLWRLLADPAVDEGQKRMTRAIVAVLVEGTETSDA